MVVRLRTGLILAVLLGTGACIVIPVPTPEWGDAPYSDEQIEALVSGVSTRTRDSVIAEFGEPANDYANGRVLLYAWSMQQGYWIVGTPGGAAGAAGNSQHRLCLRFDQAGILRDVRHLDSALWDADRQLRNLLDDWIAEIASESPETGYTQPLLVEEFSVHDQPPPTGRDGILVVNGDGRHSPCFDELVQIASRNFRFLGIETLRDRFYPWLENQWTDHLDEVATGPALEQIRKETDLRYIVVADSFSGFPVDEFCNPRSRFYVSCYAMTMKHEMKSVAVLDLQRSLSDPSIVETARHQIPRIAAFPDNEREACRLLATYAVRDIANRVN